MKKKNQKQIVGINYHSEVWAHLEGILCGICGSVQWIPSIVTHTRRESGKPVYCINGHKCSVTMSQQELCNLMAKK